MSTEERAITLEEDESPPPFLHRHRHRCCFNLPCFRSSSTTTNHQITLGSTNPTPLTTDPTTTSFWWWARPILAFKKIREWSEIVAGPKWKTFIRRFNRRRNNHRHHHHHHHNNSNVNFQYDPLSYALNFDEGGQNGHFDEDFNGHFPDFSSRYAAAIPSSKSPSELDNGAPGC